VFTKVFAKNSIIQKETNVKEKKFMKKLKIKKPDFEKTQATITLNPF
jgi:hypothetical protein